MEGIDYEVSQANRQDVVLIHALVDSRVVLLKQNTLTVLTSAFFMDDGSQLV